MKKQDSTSTGSINKLRKRCKPAKPLVNTNKKHAKMTKCHVGQPIGLMELLWRRGHMDPRLSIKELPNDKDFWLIAKEIPQFKNELSEIKIVMKELDVDVIFIPKCHCEIAGRGFEFLWGIAKMMIRKESATLDNDKRLNNLQKRVKEIITHMPLETYQRCSRCAREHKLSYAAILRDNAKHFDLKLHHIDNVKK